MPVLEFIKDYFEQDKVDEFILLLKSNLIVGWETRAGVPFLPTSDFEHRCKRGRLLVASYEAVKFQKTKLFLVVIRQIGGYIANTCSKATAYSDFYIDEDKIRNKEFEKCSLYVFCSADKEA